eukprot:jgi/Tetstr1/459712/TSEL_005065.t1
MEGGSSMAVDASVNAVPAATPAEAHGDCPTIVDHGAQLLTMLRRMCTDKLLPDVILRVESKNCGAVRYPCHRMILSLWSDVFRSMFECFDSAPEGQTQEIPLNGDDPAAIGSLVDYFYTGELALDAANVMSLLAAADKYHVGLVVEACGRYLGDQINVTSVCHVLESAQRHSAHEAERKCKKLLSSKFYQVCARESFLGLSWENIKWVLGNDKLVCESELAVFNSAMRWLAADADRKRYLHEVLEMVRFTCFSVADLGTVDSHPTATQAGDFFLRKLLTAYKATSSPTCSVRVEKSRQYYQFWVSGVMHHIPVAVIEAQGWREVYRQPYSHPTSMAEICACTANYSHVLVAAKHNSSSELELCAAGECSRVLQPTNGRYDFHEENGAHWYCWNGKAFGFSRGKQVDLFWADVCQFEGDNRLSWVLDGRGGWRVGKTFLYDASEAIHTWEKVMYVKNMPKAPSSP